MIQRQTFEFLKELVENNNREWFQAHKERFDAARGNVIDFATAILEELKKIDPDVNEKLDPKKCVMRIYRDIRFSKNKTPYKNNFGVSFPTRSLKLGGVEYYLHLTPGKSFIAGGYWMPEANHLKAIRQEIDYNAAELKNIIDDKEFVKIFGQFRAQEHLKTLPRDYASDNENIELLKLKSFIAIHEMKDNELINKNAVDAVAGLYKKVQPLTAFLNNALG